MTPFPLGAGPKSDPMADLDAFFAARLADTMPLPPARPDLPPGLGPAVLRTAPERVLQRLEMTWAAEYDRYLERLLTGGPEVWIEPEPLPDAGPVDEDALYAALTAHDRREAWRQAVARSDLEALQCAYAVTPADFADALPTLLEVAIERGQEAVLTCLLALTRTPRRGAALDRPAMLDTALIWAARHRQEPALVVLMHDEGADPARCDAAFWRCCFPHGPADSGLRDTLVGRVPGYGVALLRQAAAAEDWNRVRILADRLDAGTRTMQAEEAQRARAFLERLHVAGSRPRTAAALECLLGVWRHVAAGHPLKIMAADLGRSVSQLSRHRRALESCYRAVYGPSARFGPLEAARAWDACQGK